MVYHSRSLDATFGALADPTRRTLIERLSLGERTIGELAARIDMSLPAVSKHLRVLERAGLATIRRDGRVRRTMLVAAPMRGAAAWIARYRRFWELQFDQLAAYLESTVPSSREENDQWHPQRPSRRSKSGAHSKRRARVSLRPGRGPKSSRSGARPAR